MTRFYRLEVMIRRLHGLANTLSPAVETSQVHSENHRTVNINEKKYANEYKNKSTRKQLQSEFFVCVQFMQFPPIFLQPSFNQEISTTEGDDITNKCKTNINNVKNAIVFNVCHRAEFEIEESAVAKFFPSPCECYLLNSHDIVLAHWSCPCPLVTLCHDSDRQEAVQTKSRNKINTINNNSSKNIYNYHKQHYKEHIFNRPIYANYAMRQVSSARENCKANVKIGNRYNVINSHTFNCQGAFVGYAEMACRVLILTYASPSRKVIENKRYSNKNDCANVRSNDADCKRHLKNTANSRNNKQEKQERTKEKPYVIRVLVDNKKFTENTKRQKQTKSTNAVKPETEMIANANRESTSNIDMCKKNHSHTTQSLNILTNNLHSMKHDNSAYLYPCCNTYDKLDKKSNWQHRETTFKELENIIKYDVICQIQSVCKLCKRVLMEHSNITQCDIENTQINILLTETDYYTKELVRISNIILESFNDLIRKTWKSDAHHDHNRENDNNADEESKLASLTVDQEVAKYMSQKSALAFSEEIDNKIVEGESSKVNDNNEVHDHWSRQNGKSTADGDHGKEVIIKRKYYKNGMVASSMIGDAQIIKHYTQLNEKEYPYSNVKKCAMLNQITLLNFLRYHVLCQLQSVHLNLSDLLTKLPKKSPLSTEKLPQILISFANDLVESTQSLVLHSNILFRIIDINNNTNDNDEKNYVAFRLSEKRNYTISKAHKEKLETSRSSSCNNLSCNEFETSFQEQEHDHKLEHDKHVMTPEEIRETNNNKELHSRINIHSLAKPAVTLEQNKWHNHIKDLPEEQEQQQQQQHELSANEKYKEIEENYTIHESLKEMPTEEGTQHDSTISNRLQTAEPNERSSSTSGYEVNSHLSSSRVQSSSSYSSSSSAREERVSLSTTYTMDSFESSSASHSTTSSSIQINKEKRYVVPDEQSREISPLIVEKQMTISEIDRRDDTKLELAHTAMATAEATSLNNKLIPTSNSNNNALQSKTIPQTPHVLFTTTSISPVTLPLPIPVLPTAYTLQQNSDDNNNSYYTKYNADDTALEVKL